MKKITKIWLCSLIVMGFALILVNSCKKDDKNGDSLTNETISAKWMVTGATGNYESFEFNESGNYIVVMNAALKSTTAQIVLFGTYRIIDHLSVELSDFGTIKVSAIDAGNFTFIITQSNDPANKITINSTKAAENSNSSKTNMFCRTWEMVTLNGEPVTGTEFDLTVLFSKAGTYFVTTTDTTDGDTGGLAQWRWKDESETMMCYSWQGEPTCIGDNEVEILEVTNNSLKMQEDNLIYILKPSIHTKSSALKSIKITLDQPVKKGFIK